MLTSPGTDRNTVPSVWNVLELSEAGTGGANPGADDAPRSPLSTVLVAAALVLQFLTQDQVARLIGPVSRSPQSRA